MHALVNSPDQASDCTTHRFELGYYAKLASASDLNDLKRRISNIVQRLGFSDFNYQPLLAAQSERPILSTLPATLLDHYFSKRLYFLDMNLQCARQNSDPFYHSSVHDYVAKAPFKTDTTQCMKTISETNKNYGYYDFYSIPTNSHNNNQRVLLTVTLRGASPMDLKRIVAECSADLQLLCEAIDFVTNQRFAADFLGDDTRKKHVINPKPLRVLNALANNDLTINQVAEKLCISVVTANQHLKTVRKSLGTQTNYAAIKLALRYGLIHHSDNEDDCSTP